MNIVLAVALTLAVGLVVLLARHVRRLNQIVDVLAAGLHASREETAQYRLLWRQTRIALWAERRRYRRGGPVFGPEPAAGTELASDLLGPGVLAAIEAYANQGAGWRDSNCKDLPGDGWPNRKEHR